MEFWVTVTAIVVALLIHGMVKDAIAGVATITGELVATVLRKVMR